MKKIIVALFMLIMSPITQATDSECPNPLSPCAIAAKKKALESTNLNQQHFSKGQTEFDELLSKQAENQEMYENKRKMEIERRKKQQNQKLLSFARQKHEEAVARRNGGLSLSAQAFEKKRALDKKRALLLNADKSANLPILPDSRLVQKKYLDIYAPYEPHSKAVPSYKKDNFPRRYNPTH